MKKFVVICLLSLLALGLIGNILPQPILPQAKASPQVSSWNTVFTEDFETDLSQWIVTGTGSAEITSEVKHGGSCALNIATSANHVEAFHRFNPFDFNDTQAYLSMYIYVQQSASAGVYPQLELYCNTSARTMGDFILRWNATGAKMHKQNTPLNPDFSFPQHCWNRFELLTNITGMYVWVNENLVGNWTDEELFGDYRQTFWNMLGLGYSPSTYTAKFFIDDIVVKSNKCPADYITDWKQFGVDYITHVMDGIYAQRDTSGSKNTMFSTYYDIKESTRSDYAYPELLFGVYAYQLTGNKTYLTWAKQCADDIYPISHNIYGTYYIPTYNYIDDIRVDAGTKKSYLPAFWQLCYYDTKYIPLAENFTDTQLKGMDPDTKMYKSDGNKCYLTFDCLPDFAQVLILGYKITGNATYKQALHDIIFAYWSYRNSTTNLVPLMLYGNGTFIPESETYNSYFLREYDMDSFMWCSQEAYCATSESDYLEVIRKLSDAVVKYFWNGDVGFYYRVNTNGTVRSEISEMWTGSLCQRLIKSYELTGNVTYYNIAKSVFDYYFLEDGQFFHGGVLHGKTQRTTSQPWGVPSTVEHRFYQVVQPSRTAITLHRYTGNNTYLNLFKRHFVNVATRSKSTYGYKCCISAYDWSLKADTFQYWTLYAFYALDLARGYFESVARADGDISAYISAAEVGNSFHGGTLLPLSDAGSVVTSLTSSKAVLKGIINDTELTIRNDGDSKSFTIQFNELFVNVPLYGEYNVYVNDTPKKTVTASQILNGFDVTLEGEKLSIVTFCGNEPYIVSLSCSSIDSISFDNFKLTFVVSSETTSTTKIYCGSEGEPTTVSGATSWSYDSTTKICTITATHSSVKEVVVSWATGDNPPTLDTQGHSTTTAGEPCKFYSKWQDDDSLSDCIFGTNLTGSWQNETHTLTSNPDWCNVTKTLPSKGGVRVEYQFWANDSADQWTTSNLQYFTTTAVGVPTYSDIGYNTTLAGNITEFSCYWQDPDGLSQFIFSWNGTGSWTNDTASGLTGTADWANLTKTLPSNVGVVVGFRWYCNDTGDNWAATGIQNLTTTETTVRYWFRFSFKDLDNNDVESKITWTLYNSSQALSYTEGETTLLAGTYTLKTCYHSKFINETSFTTETYGNTTVNIYLMMKAYANGYIAFNNTITSIIINSQTSNNLTFTVEGSSPQMIIVDVLQNASRIQRNGVKQTDWTYNDTSKYIQIDAAALSVWQLTFEGLGEPYFTEALIIATVVAVGSGAVLAVAYRRKKKSASAP